MAEVMAAAVIDNIMITTAVIGESKIFRLLHARNSARISVVADNEDNINMLGRMAQLAGQQAAPENQATRDELSRLTATASTDD